MRNKFIVIYKFNIKKTILFYTWHLKVSILDIYYIRQKYINEFNSNKCYNYNRVPPI